jgi:hypothetical protein
MNKIVQGCKMTFDQMTKQSLHNVHTSIKQIINKYQIGGSRDRMVVGFTTTYAISA